jgi:uncharacterized membrane protein YiaA
VNPTLLTGTLHVWTLGSYTADVELLGGRGYYLTTVPVSRAIPAAEMVTGRRVYIIAGDPAIVTDCIVVAVY